MVTVAPQSQKPSIIRPFLLSQGELIRGVQVIKLMSWEESLLSDILGIRGRELNKLARSLHLKASQRVINYVSPTLVAFATFLAFAALEGTEQLTLERV